MYYPNQNNNMKMQPCLPYPNNNLISSHSSNPTGMGMGMGIGGSSTLYAGPDNMQAQVQAQVQAPSLRSLATLPSI